MATVETRNRATSSEESRKDVLKRVEKESTSSCSWFRDRGAPEELCDHAGRASRPLSDDGMGFDGSSITGFNAIEESDMVAILIRRRSS